jgi:hypothetical protein
MNQKIGELEKMIILFHIDWYGTAERLKKRDEAQKKASEKTEGSKYLGRYVPWNKKYHWTYMIKVDDISNWMKTMQNLEWERDYKEMDHGEIEIYSVPR